VLKQRYSLVKKWANAIDESEGGLEKFSKVRLTSSHATPGTYPARWRRESHLTFLFQGYETFGLIAQPNGDIVYREWAPNAVEASLVGDFSKCCPNPFRHKIALLRLADNWDVNANQMKKNAFGVWEVTVPAQNGAPAIPHDSKIKASDILLRDKTIRTN